MMKKILIFAVVLSLLVPAAAFAATEFTLGGYVKLDTYWDSTMNNESIQLPVLRSNDASGGGDFHHGNLRFTAMGSRFNFTIKGPDVLGAKLTGFIEMDFDSSENQASSPSGAYIPRLRHAMFRLNWPCDTELLFGQYWSMFCDYFAEATEDSDFYMTGTPTARLAQIRLTQKFAGDWQVAGLVGQGNNDGLNGAVAGVFSGSPYDTSAGVNSAGASETPQVQAQVKYQHDLWGKAPFYGVPMPFTASVTAGWQRNVARYQAIATTDFNGIAAPGTAYMNNTYVSPWLLQASLFIPVIPTYNNNLAGTAHILFQPWIGQGVNAFGMTGDSTNVFKIDYNGGRGGVGYDAELLKRFGFLAEAQYWFTNQWYFNAAYGLSAAYGIDSGWGAFYNAAAAQMRTIQQVDATLWYRPIAALKFGLQYSYAHAQYLTDAYPNGSLPSAFNPPTNNNGGSLSRSGDEHRVEFVGIFYF
jgi:hypothetical protein